jgi:4-amino-4-deoxy-L-arabinose transferase-like glycosyltransferase
MRGRIANFVEKYRSELVIFGAAFIVRALYAVLVEYAAGARGFIAFSDAEFFYFRSAVNVVEHGTFSIAASAPFYQDAYHTPLYALFVAALLFVHLPLFGIVLVQDVIAAVTVLLIYRIAKLLTGSRGIAIAAAAVSAVEPMSIYWSGLLMSDTLFAFLMVLAVYWLLTDRPYLAAASIGLATLTRPIGLYFGVAFVAMLLYREISRGRSLRDAFRLVGAVVMIFVVVVTPWVVRNKVAFGKAALSSASWYLFYNFPVQEFAHEEHVVVPAVAVVDPERVTRFDFTHEDAYHKAALAAVSVDPVGFTRVYVDRALYSIMSDRYDYLLNVVVKGELPRLYSKMPEALVRFVLLIGKVFWVAVYALVAISIADRRLRPWWMFFAALVAINVALSGGINPVGTDMSRYMQPLYVFLFVFAGVGAKWLLDRANRNGGEESRRGYERKSAHAGAR